MAMHIFKAMRFILYQLAVHAFTFHRRVKQAWVLTLDATLCIVTVWLAFYLQLGEWVSLAGAAKVACLSSVALALPLFMIHGVYRPIFRYSGLHAMLSLVRAFVLYGAGFAAIFTVWGVNGVPRNVGLIQPILLLLLVGTSRAAVRIWLGDLYEKQHGKAFVLKALIYGAGSAGRQLASAMYSSHEICVVGFLDDDERLHGHLLNGLPIYNPRDLDKILYSEAITDVLLALPSVSRQRRNEILNSLKLRKVAVRTVPGLSDIALGRVSLSDVHDLDIEDLLGRESVKPSNLMLSLELIEKTVLVTGAGGSIGGELCRQLIKTKPSKLLLVEMSEFALYKIHQELQVLLAASFSKVSELKDAEGGAKVDNCLYPPAIEIVPLLGSVSDEIRMNEIMRTWKPHTVYHAAAYKHVPLVEHNPAEGVINNVLGTKVCAEASARNGVHNFILISTDKAVRPTNIMGATKRLAEMVLQAMHEQSATLTGRRVCFSMVRFGNVLGSSGSVVPLFREQIKNGGPITLTHNDITRYFMSIPEAAQLVIQTGVMATGGDVFVLDMGEPVRIIDLARRMVELSGLTVRDVSNPFGDIEIKVNGLRPGEKLFEELLIGDNPLPTDHPRIMKAHEEFLPWDDLQIKLTDLLQALNVNDVPLIRTLIKDLVPGYQPVGEVVDWVWQAQQSKKI